MRECVRGGSIRDQENDHQYEILNARCLLLHYLGGGVRWCEPAGEGGGGLPLPAEYAKGGTFLVPIMKGDPTQALQHL